MASLKIGFPKKNRTAHLTGNGVFVASGRASGDVTQVSGECWLGDTGKKSTGQNVLLIPYPGGGSDDKKRWSMMFKVEGLKDMEMMDYHLEVKGWAGDREVTPQEVDFKIMTRASAVLTITWPGNGENIAGDAGDFAPYGELSGESIASVTMESTATPPASVGLIYLYGDSDELFCWVAQFETVPPVSSPVTYTLTAQTSSVTLSSTGLHF